jgi:hypothetical protein
MTRALVLLGVLLGGVSPLQAAGVERFAVVVGNNVAPVEDLMALHYADDDAARLYEFLTAAGHHARLLTVLDEESQSTFPRLVSHAVPPGRQQVLEVLSQVQTEMKAAHERGAIVEFVFAFAGHGKGGPEGGAIFLLDGPFTRQDLSTHVVGASPADFNHILIDACDSYFMVAARGGAYQDDRVGTPDAMDLVRNYLEGDGPTQDVRTGWLVSTNQAAQTHEFQGFGAGVFSHVVHSALTGAADANRDGSVEYSEVLAYAAAAAQQISDPRARLNVFGRAPPRDVHHPLMDLRTARFAHFLRLGPDISGRLYVEDDRNVRYVDLHKAPGTDVILALADARVYRVVRDGDGREARVDLKLMRRGAVRLGDFVAPNRAARGGGEMRRELFAIPFDSGFYRGFVASQQLTPAVAGSTFEPPEASRQGWLPQRPRFLFGIPGLVMLGGGGLLGVGAGVATLLTKLAYDAYVVTLRETGLPDAQQEQRINALRITAGLLVAGGLAALALGGILVAVELLWPAGRGEETP